MTLRQPMGTEGHGFHIAFPNTAGGAAQARKQLIRFIEHFHLSRAFISDVEIVAGEALANAAEHGYKPHGTIIVDAWLTEAYLEGAISDDGPGFAVHGPVSMERPITHSPRGYGLFLMRTLVDEFEFRNDGKTVWFRKHITRGE